MNTKFHVEGAAAPPASELAGLISLEEISSRYPRLFAGVESVRWYLRSHRPGLLAEGALLVISGKLMLVPAKFEEYVIKAGQEAAKRRAAVQEAPK